MSSSRLSSRLPDDKRGRAALPASHRPCFFFFMSAANEENRSRVCKQDGSAASERGRSLFTLASPGLNVSAASLNYCLHANIKLYQKDPHPCKNVSKSTEIHIQGQPYLSATVAAAKICIVLNHKCSRIVHNLHNCLMLLSKGVGMEACCRDLHNSRCSDM